jgi:hypothetical protein
MLLECFHITKKFYNLFYLQLLKTQTRYRSNMRFLYASPNKINCEFLRLIQMHSAQHILLLASFNKKFLDINDLVTIGI